MRSFTFALLLAFVAFGLRVGFTLAFRGGLDVPPSREQSGGADPIEYDQLARQVSAGKGFTDPNGTPTSFRAPGFPLFLAVVYGVFGDAYWPAYLAMAVLGAVGSIGGYLLGRELLGETRGRWAGVVYALYPGDIYACSYFFSEALFAPCLGFGLWQLARHVRTGSLLAAVAAGLLLGYAALTRSFAILFLPIFALYLVVLVPPRRNWAAAAVFSLGFLAVVGPWTIRNFQVHDRFVLIATNGGSTFYGANNDHIASTPREFGYWVSTTRLPGRELIEAQPDEVSHDKMEWKLGVKWVRQNPKKFLLLAPFKVARFWLPFVGYSSFKVYPVANIALTTPFLVLILTGLIYTLRPSRWRQFAVLHLTMLANLVMVVIFWGGERFRDANVPVLVVYAVVGGYWLVDRLRTRTPIPRT